MPNEAGDGSAEASGPVAACEPHHLRAGALPGPEFQRGILRDLGVIEGVEARSIGPFRIQVGVRDEAYHVRLDEQFKRYRHGEIEPRDAVEEIKAALKLPGAAIEAAGPFPRLARPEALDAATHRLPCPFDPDLVVFFVRELPTGHLPISVAELRAGWSGAAEGLLDESLANLSQRSAALSPSRQGEGVALNIGFASGDGFDAARLLLPGLAEALGAQLPGRAHFGIPSRDLLMGVGDADPDFLSDAGEHLRARHASAGAEALSPRWYVLDAAGRLAIAPG